MTTLEDELVALRIKVDGLQWVLDHAMGWQDGNDDEWSEEIRSAHPIRSASHEQYGEAMRMVSNRRSKFELVNLVNWLLLRIHRLEEV